MNRYNLERLLPTILAKLTAESTMHVAIDTEFTGLGSKHRKTFAKDLRDRYKALKETASTHALVSIGISIFQADQAEQPGQLELDNDKEKHYRVFNYSIMLLCMKEYTVSPTSLSFLVDNGFDFNKQISEGVPYMPGDDDTNDPFSYPSSTTSASSNSILPSTATPSHHLRALFKAIIRVNCPLVLHNGLLDIMFLYNAFYAQLPESLDTFVADVADWFGDGGGTGRVGVVKDPVTMTEGVQTHEPQPKLDALRHRPHRGYLVDTKCIADYVSREPVSFLSYLFRKYERNSGVKNKIHVVMEDEVGVEEYGGEMSATASFRRLTRMKDWTDRKRKRNDDSTSAGDGKMYCVQYASHGYCPDGTGCSKSHDLDLILDHEDPTIAAALKKKGKQHHSSVSKASEDDGENLPVEVAAVSVSTVLTSSSTSASVISKSEKEFSVLTVKNSIAASTLQLQEKPTQTIQQDPSASTQQKQEKSIQTIQQDSSKSTSSSFGALSSTPLHASSSKDQQQSIVNTGTRTTTSAVPKQFHSACYDAYMTGYIYANQIEMHGEDSIEKNLVYLIGKDRGLKLGKSAFAKCSREHLRKSDVA